MKTWILLFCLLLASCGGRQAQFSDHEDFYWIDFRPLVKNEALEVGLNEWGTNPRYVQLETNEFIQIKFIQRVILDGDKFLVVHSDRLSLFDKDGNVAGGLEDPFPLLWLYLLPRYEILHLLLYNFVLFHILSRNRFFDTIWLLIYPCFSSFLLNRYYPFLFLHRPA